MSRHLFSRDREATLTPAKNAWIQDLGSSKGTSVNEAQIAADTTHRGGSFLFTRVAGAGPKR